MFKLINSSLLISLLLTVSAHAYGGPGSSLGVVLVVLGIIGTVFLSILSFFWYPIKRFFKKMKNKETETDTAHSENNPSE